MSGASALSLQGIEVAAGGRTVCRGVDLELPHGEIHVLFGPNGSGKSSLLSAIMGLPGYRLTAGRALLDGVDLSELDLAGRARAGLGIAYQRPPAINGVSIAALAESLGATGRLRDEEAALDLVDFESRDVNSGFSGGEIKRWEILKLFLQQPEVCLFDEPKSGVDLEHIAAVGAAIERLLAQPAPSGRQRSALIITHTGFILDYVQATTGHMMIDGRIVHSGPAIELFDHIRNHGYSVPGASAA